MLAGSRRSNVSHSRQSSLFEIYVVLIQINNMTGEFRVVKKTVNIEKRHPNDLRSPIATVLTQRPVSNLRIIILNIELPGNPTLLKTIKYGEQIRVSIFCGSVASRLGSCPKQM